MFVHFSDAIVSRFLTLALLFCCLDFGTSRVIHPTRLRRNTFDPPLPPFPNSNTPFAWPAPYPLPAASTMSPAEALMPHPPKYHDPDNPYLDVMSEPINPNYGLGFSAVQPTLLGGGINFPTGNLLRPQENVGGTFGFSRPVNVRFGNQGGPFFPWQDKQFAKSVKEISAANSIASRRDVPTFPGLSNQQNSLNSETPLRLFDLPPLPPNYRVQ